MFAAGDTETVQVVRPAGRDRFGDPVGVDAAPRPVDGCLVAPGSSIENSDHANQVTTDLTLYAPIDADILPADRVIVRGDTYEVDGYPQRWGTSGLVIGLRRVTG